MTADTIEKNTLHQTSLAVWDIPTPAAGERFSIKVGAKSSAGCALGARRIEVLDGAAVAAASISATRRGPARRCSGPKSNACRTAGPRHALVRFDAAELDEPHEGVSSPFKVSVVARPEHTLTVKVVADGVPVEEAIVRLGPMRAITDTTGVAAVKLAKGRYELVVWKAGYDAPAMPLTIDADAFVQIDARRPPEPDPDAVWTA